MGKDRNPRRVADNEAMAVSRMLKTSPQKLNLVASLIRNKPVGKALADLTFSKKRVSEDVKKTLQSAIANAENNHGLDVDELVVAEAWVGKNLVLKRGQPRARGRFGRILKPFSQVTIKVRQVQRGAGLMGQKINPVGLRLQVNRTWDSRWFADGTEYGKLLHEDLAIRDFIKKAAAQAGVSRVVIERPHRKCRVTIHAARPGVIIGKKGADIEVLRKKLAQFTKSELHLNIVEVRKPEIDAALVAENVAQQLERRVSFRRAMKRAVQNSMRMGALGIRINVAGRLGGAEIARTEWYREGRVPLHTLRADIDYAVVEAKTAYGIIGIKVWIFKGEIMEHDPAARDRRQSELQEGGGMRPQRSRERILSLRERDNAATQAHQVPQAVQGPHPWPRQGRARAELRQLRPEGGRARPRDRPPDRGGPPGAHPPHEAPGPGLDPRLPRRAGPQEADRGPHGQGQGRGRVLGRQGKARPHHVRD